MVLQESIGKRREIGGAQISVSAEDTAGSENAFPWFNCSGVECGNFTVYMWKSVCMHLGRYV